MSQSSPKPQTPKVLLRARAESLEAEGVAMGRDGDAVAESHPGLAKDLRLVGLALEAHAEDLRRWAVQVSEGNPRTDADGSQIAGG